MGKQPSVPAKMKGKHDAIAALLEPFCRGMLNEEYREACMDLLFTLGGGKPSPLVSGTAAAWASGIVRTIGWVNFLDDKTQTPHMKMAEIDKAFGVSPATGQGKSKLIREMMGIEQLDMDWTLPSKLEQNPLIWMVHLKGGMIADIRRLPREIQVEAFERGMIPYVPADRKGMENGAGE